ncbi:MAG: hypothetical protein ATN31_10210 [Candidatus Epulonipiscioides saccharophilum]|nr:MAG: hypothetical protein ATN31_10210 [Epulopiscium sp. AS2M-Bin001]
MKSIKIFVSHDTEKTITIDNSIYQNILTQAREEKVINSFFRDDIGDNISDKYNRYQELTVQYWAWKNVDADYYGLCTQNKYLSFSNSNIRNNPKTNFEFPAPYFDEHPTIDPPIKFEYLNNSNIQKLNLFDQAMKDAIEPYDMIITSHLDWDITVMQQFDVPSVLDNKLQLALNLIDEFSPEFSVAAHEYLNGYVYYPGQLYVMKKELFNEYCNWSFKILDELEKRIDFSNYSIEGLKILYYISERLLGVYYTYLKNQNKYKLRELDWCKIEHTEIQDSILPIIKDHNKAIVLTFSNEFIIGAAATILSVIKNSSDDYQYDIVCFNKNLTQENKNLFYRLIKNKNNFSIRFYDVGYLMSNYNLYLAKAHWVDVSYYKLLIPEIMNHYDKVLFLDSDLIILEDISKLLELDLTNYDLAASTGINYIATNARRPWANKYNNQKIKLKNIFDYFMSGMFVLNLKEIGDKISSDQLLLQVNNSNLVLEETILNISFQDKSIYILDPTWQVCVKQSDFVLELLRKYTPEYMYTQYINSRQKPKIIHYLGPIKPWDFPNSDLSHYWWNTVRGTEIYELAINSQIKKVNTENAKQFIQNLSSQI